MIDIYAQIVQNSKGETNYFFGGRMGTAASMSGLRFPPVSTSQREGLPFNVSNTFPGEKNTVAIRPEVTLPSARYLGGGIAVQACTE